MLSFGFDIICFFEGERTFPEIVRRLIEKKKWKDIEGIIYTDREGLKINRTNKVVNLDCFPPFSWNLRPTIESMEFERPCTPIEIMRGCPWGCKFCHTPYFMGRKSRSRSIENIKKYLKILSRFEKEARFIAPNSLAYGIKGKKPNLKKNRKTV